MEEVLIHGRLVCRLTVRAAPDPVGRRAKEGKDRSKGVRGRLLPHRGREVDAGGDRGEASEGRSGGVEEGEEGARGRGRGRERKAERNEGERLWTPGKIEMN